MAKVEETQLPGVGVRHDFMTEGGARVGVINHRSGRRELLIYAQTDPDAASEVLRLSEEEGHTLADLLGGTTLTVHVANVQKVEGVAMDWVKIDPGSRAEGSQVQTVGRRPTGVSIVAVVRAGNTIPTPGGEFVLEEGDTAVVVGTLEAIRSFAAVASSRGG